jgi:hypothetical protein
MPAASSLPVDPVFCHLFAAADGLDGDRATVPSVLAAVADPWARRGVRHRLAVILALAVCAVLAGARSFTAIAEWAADLPTRWVRFDIFRETGQGRVVGDTRRSSLSPIMDIM